MYKDEYDLQSVNSYISINNKSNRYDDSDTIFIKRTLQRDLPKKAREEFLKIFFQKYVTEDEFSFSKELYLSMEQISEMAENGMYFGSHGYSHEWFDNISENVDYLIFVIDCCVVNQIFLISEAKNMVGYYS